MFKRLDLASNYSKFEFALPKFLKVLVIKDVNQKESIKCLTRSYTYGLNGNKTYGYKIINLIVGQHTARRFITKIRDLIAYNPRLRSLTSIM